MHIVELIPLIAIALSVRCLQIINDPPWNLKKKMWGMSLLSTPFSANTASAARQYRNGGRHHESELS